MDEPYALDVLPRELSDFLDAHLDAEVAVLRGPTLARTDPSHLHPRLATFAPGPLVVKYGSEARRRAIHAVSEATGEHFVYTELSLAERHCYMSVVPVPDADAVILTFHDDGRIGSEVEPQPRTRSLTFRARTDVRSRVLWAEPEFYVQFGGAPDSDAPVVLFDLVDESNVDAAYASWMDTLAFGMMTERVLFTTADGSSRWFQTTSRVDGKHDSVEMLFSDVTEDVRARDVLESRERTFRDLAETVPLGIFRANAAGELLYTNSRFDDVFGLSTDDRIPFENLTTLDGAPALDALTHMLTVTNDTTIDLQLESKGRPRFVRVRVRRHRNEDEETEVVGSAEDITREIEMQARLEQEALTDPVAGVGNRRALELDLAARLDTMTPDPFALLMCDLDGFKQVNDSLGHEAGDHIIGEVGQRLRMLARERDLVARLGGDEFVLIADGIDDYDAALEVAERLLPEIRRPYEYLGSHIELSGSIGVVLAESNSTALGLIQMADHAMYEAKRSGRNQARSYHSPDQSTVISPLALRRDLRRAIAADALDLAFQPIYAFSDDLRQPRGAEALLRWNHPVMGHIPPTTLIPLAEQSGLITDLGEWILNAAVVAVAQVNREREPEDAVTISINLSALQLGRPGFADDVHSLLERRGVSPDEVLFELTETYLVDQVDNARQTLDSLHSMGITLAVDDFGTGYATLDYLLELPVEVVKIDPSFTRRLLTDRGRAMFHGLATGCRELGMLVVVEGVESKDMLDAAREAGATHAQGFYLGRPVSIGGLGDDRAAEDFAA